MKPLTKTTPPREREMARTLTQTDQVLLAAALLNAGIKARIRKIRNGLRVVFDGPSAPVADLLNDEGFLHANGCPFDRFSFDGNQAFVRYVRA